MSINRKKIAKPFDYLFVLRPMLFFPGWSTLLAGFFIDQKAQWYAGAGRIQSADHRLIILLFMLFGSAMGASFLLNQLQDTDSDRENHKLFIISQGHISGRAVLAEIILLILLALVLGFSLSVPLGIFTALFILLTGYIYNYRPFRFKDYPLRSLAANAAMGWLAFALGWAGRFPLNRHLLTDSLPYLFFNTALYLYTTLPDREGDLKSHKRTLAAVLSLPALLYFAFGLYVLGLLSALFLQDNTALLIIMLSAPFFLLTLRNKTISAAVRTTKFAILFFALAVCLKWPWYFLLMTGGFYATKLYFKMRFDFDYPNFKAQS